MNFGIRRYRITLITPMLGTVPKSREVYDEFIAQRDLDRGATPEQTAESSETTPGLTEAQQAEDKPSPVGKTGFPTDAKGIFLFDNQVRGLVREAGNVLSYQLDIKNLRSKITQLVFLGPRRIRMFNEDKKQITEPNSVNTRPIRVVTMQGPRTSIVQSDQVDEGTYFEIEIKILENKDGIDFDTVEELLSYGELQGLLQFRTGGFGRFTYEMVKEIKAMPPKRKEKEKEEVAKKK